MGQDKKQLELLLEFVEKVYANPLNKEFIDGIRQLVLNDKDVKVGAQASTAPSESINNIESYLSLDFHVDGMEMPDFSLIKDEDVRNKLTSDFREMLRYRFGTRNHRIDFPEFCRYATLQIEMLVNYFYDKKYGSDITLIKKVVTDGNTTVDAQGRTKCYFTCPENTTDVSSISLKPKIQALQPLFGWRYLEIVPYLNAVEVRNQQSHRSLLLRTDIIQEVEEQLTKEGIMKVGKMKRDYVDYNAAKQFLGTKLWNEYSFQKWLDEQPFDSVILSISRLCKTIASSLLNAV